jgi:hypothetical protein
MAGRVRAESRDAAGSISHAFTPRCTRWARVIKFRGSVADVPQQNGVELWDIKLAIRFDDSIELSDYVEYRGQRYRILHRAEVGRRVEHEFLLKRVG